MPRDNSRLETHPALSATRVRAARHLEALNGRYAPELVRARVEAAVCDVSTVPRKEVIEAVTATVLRSVRSRYR